MKYIVFIVAAIGVPPFAFILSQNRRWIKYAFIGVVVAMCVYTQTSINFFSNENYRGSARGMEVSLAHLMALAVLLALAFVRKLKYWAPDAGYRLYVLYFLLCLPSLSAAADGMIAWYEIWKMIMLYVFYVSVFNYLAATDDLKTVTGCLGVFAIVNMLLVVKEHLAGVYQPHGVFPHQNGMAVAMHLFGTLFFAGYLMRGLRTKMGRFSLVAFACAAGGTARSYSRMALALMPIGYGLTFLLCVLKGRPRYWKRRIAPIAILGSLVMAAMMPRIIQRFQTAPESSGGTRLELARVAMEMIRDEPWRGVGINNWGIKINQPYEYAERAGRNTGRGEDFKDGIVETVYLLVGAECGLPALCAMLAWFLWYWARALALAWRMKNDKWFFVPAGLFGGMTVAYLQSCLEWVFRQQLNLICLMFMFATLSYLDKRGRDPRFSAVRARISAKPPSKEAQ